MASAFTLVLVFTIVSFVKYGMTTKLRVRETMCVSAMLAYGLSVHHSQTMVGGFSRMHCRGDTIALRLCRQSRWSDRSDPTNLADW